MTKLTLEHNEVKDLVSIVIPTYNGERFIAESLDVVSRQSYPNWEILVVEDGSRDGTQEIVESFAQRNPSRRVEYLRCERNRGPSHARNLAFAKVRGEFVALLDVDDRWLPDHLAVSLESLRTTGSDVAYSTVVMFEDQSEILLGVWGPDWNDLSDFPYGLFRRNFITPSATVMRRQVLADIGIWDTRLRYCEDLDFWLRCLAAGKKFQHVSGLHTLYRRNHKEAATGNTCAVLEVYAQTIERYMVFPGLRERRCRKFVYNAYLQAAAFHAQMDPQDDPTADPARIGPLMLHAWRLRPKHVEFLFKGSMHSLRHWFKRHRRVRLAPILSAAPEAAQAQSAAA
jgi:glycosyltransferase involved in cell wall biosynthesis